MTSRSRTPAHDPFALDDDELAWAAEHDPDAYREIEAIFAAELEDRRRHTRPALPGTPGALAALLTDGREEQAAHLDVIDDVYRRIDAGEADRIILMLPPQHGKTRRASRWGPLWYLTRHPQRHVIVASYGAELAAEHGQFVRDVIEEHPELGLALHPANRARHRWMLAGAGGGMRTAGVGGPLTGRPGHLIVVDDPYKNREEADSPEIRRKVQEWWTGTILTRQQPDTAIMVIQTAWHEDDLAHWLQREQPGRWTVIRIPAIAEPTDAEPDPLGRAEGEPLWPEHGFDLAWYADQKLAVGSRDWAALYQQRPAPAKGAIWRRGWWRRHLGRAWEHQVLHGTYRVAPTSQVIQSWDLAFKDSDDTDYVVGGVWEFDGVNAYLVDLVRARMDIVATIAAVEGLKAKWPQTSAVLIEDKANGPAVMTLLRGRLPGMIPENPTESKTARAKAVAPFIEAGNVFIPEPEIAPWVEDYVEECAAFGAGARHDDQVDMTSQALRRLFLPDDTAQGGRQVVMAGRWAGVSGRR